MTKPHPTLFAIRATFAELGLRMPPPHTEFALGRLMGLEVASRLGDRAARRTLARERQRLFDTCFAGPADAETPDDQFSACEGSHQGGL